MAPSLPVTPPSEDAPRTAQTPPTASVIRDTKLISPPAIAQVCLLTKAPNNAWMIRLSFSLIHKLREIFTVFFLKLILERSSN